MAAEMCAGRRAHLKIAAYRDENGTVVQPVAEDAAFARVELGMPSFLSARCFLPAVTERPWTKPGSGAPAGLCVCVPSPSVWPAARRSSSSQGALSQRRPFWGEERWSDGDNDRPGREPIFYLVLDPDED